MFPDSKLCTEKNLVIKDISHTNSIHKVYVCTMGVEKLRKGILLYCIELRQEVLLNTHQ